MCTHKVISSVKETSANKVSHMFNPCRTEFIWGNTLTFTHMNIHLHIHSTFCHMSPHQWNGVGNWKHSSRKTWTRSSDIANTMANNDLVTQGAILGHFSLDIPVSSSERLNFRDSLQLRHNGRDCVSIHQRLDCLLNCLFGHRSKKTSKLHVTGLCEGNSLGTCEFPAQKASNAENVSIWWRHHIWLPMCTHARFAFW